MTFEIKSSEETGMNLTELIHALNQMPPYALVYSDGDFVRRVMMDSDGDVHISTE